MDYMKDVGGGVPKRTVIGATMPAVHRPRILWMVSKMMRLSYNTFSHYGHSSTKYLDSRDIPVQNIQSVGIFQYKTFSQ
jgi:hypothetical protein